MPKRQKPSAANVVNFDTLYPAVAGWRKDWSWIEVGQDDYPRSFIRVLDIGGLIWEGKNAYPSLDAALRAAGEAIKAWHAENG